jgi:hypothetical protein
MTAPDIIGDAYGLRDDERSRGRRELRGTASAVAASGWTIGVIAAAISAVLGTAIFAAVSLSGAGVQPEEVLPGSAFAFAKVDFDPPSGQKLAVRGLTKRFPDAPAEELVGLRDELIRSILEDDDIELDFARDIAPWLGDRVGVAAFKNSAGEPDVVVALQTSDADATRRALLKGSGGEDVPAMKYRRGYALIAEDTASLDQALALADKEALAEHDRFQADRGTIGDDQIVVGWADNAVLGEVFLGEVHSMSGGDPGEATLEERVEDAFRGRTMLGVHAAPRHVELEVVSLDGAPGAGGASPTTLERLPDDTVAALYVHNVAKIADDLGGSLGVLGTFGQGMFFPYGLPGADWTSESYTAAPGLGDSEVSPVQCLEPPSDTGGDPMCPPAHEVPPEIKAQIDESRRQGLAMQVLTEQLLPLLQGETTLSLAGVPGDGIPSLGLTAKVRAPGNAVSPLAEALRGFGLDPETVTTKGDLVLAATDAKTLDGLRSGGRLGASESFRAAMGDLSSDTSAAVYVSLDALESLDDYPAELRPLRAVGVVVTESPGRSSLRLRVVVDG